MTDDDSQARNRHFALSAIRLVGMALVMAGFVLIAGKWELLGAPVDRILGAALVLIGVIDVAVVPLLLARRWKSANKP